MKRILPLVLLMSAFGTLMAQRNCGLEQYAKTIDSAYPANAGSGLRVAPAAVSSIQSASTVIMQSQQSTAVPDIIVIPVIVHILYNNAQENISDQQVFSQIAALNRDYRGTNADRSKVPAYFAGVAADCGIMFKLAQTDQQGNATSGIVRKQTSVRMFGVDDRIKSSVIGGDDAWNRNKYLNIWVGNLAGGILGYTSTPGGVAEKDGVVIQYTAFGTTANVAAPFNLGRTATHEIGHWLNLRHIWGDDFCGDDAVDDTPTQRASNRGCPGGEKFTCGSTAHGDMYMNFMDLTDDACMFMFTEGQKRRMRAMFQSFGFRNAMLTSNATETGNTVSAPVPAQTVVSVSEYAVYPNPAGANITVTVTGNQVNETLNMFNAMGQQVISQALTSNRTSIDISQLKPGLYFIKIGSKKSGTMVKFVKN